MDACTLLAPWAKLTAICVMPALTPVARLGCVPVPAIVATDVTLEVQFAGCVRSWSGPLLKCSVAVNNWVPPTAMVGLVGVIEIAVSELELLLLPHPNKMPATVQQKRREIHVEGRAWSCISLQIWQESLTEKTIDVEQISLNRIPHSRAEAIARLV